MTKNKPKYQRNPQGLSDKSAKPKKIVFSFEMLDRNQGQSFEEWQTHNILALLCEKLAGISKLSVEEAKREQIIKEYPVFPTKTEFTHPKHVPDDVLWASMHIQGKECVIGYFETNIFYIVFLDKEHEFWKTDLQDRNKIKR